jgi:hypothetical protein
MTEREPVRDLAEPDGGIQVPVVMPCLNEADTLATCVGKALDVSMTGTEESRFRTRERRLAAHAWSVSSL